MIVEHIQLSSKDSTTEIPTMTNSIGLTASKYSSAIRPYQGT